MLSRKIMEVFRGVCLAYLLTSIVLAVLAFLVYQFEIGEGIVNGGIVITYIVATFLGGIYVGKRTKEKKFLWGIALGMLYFAIIILVSYFVHGTVTPVSQHMITTWLLCVGGGMLGGMFG